MNSLPIELITNEISTWLLPIDKQIIRRVNVKFRDLFPFEEVEFNDTKLGLVHLIKYKKHWNNDTSANASRNGCLNSLKYLHENGCPWDKYTTFHAATNGHFDCLKYAHENNCPWDEYIAIYAVNSNNLDCLKYVLDNKGSWHRDVYSIVAKYGNINIMKYCYENNYPWNFCNISLAAKGALDSTSRAK